MYGSSSQMTSIQGLFVAGLFNQDGIKAKKVFLKNVIVYLMKHYLFHRSIYGTKFLTTEAAIGGVL